jgi:hypothetical protein
MKCKKVQRFLTDYISAELSAKKRQEVEGHLKACSGCRAALELLQEVWDGLAQQPIPQKDEQFWGELTRGVMQEIRRRQPIPGNEKKAFVLPGWKVLLPTAAAAIAIIVGLIVIRGDLQGPEGRVAQGEEEALVEAASNLSFGPVVTEEEDPLGSEMTLQEVSLVAESLNTSLPSTDTAEITEVLTQLYNGQDLYRQLEGLTGEELDTFYELLSSKYPYS